LEEARLISTDPKVESQRIISEANALADKTRAEGKASGERLLEYRADLEADRIKKAAKKRALEVRRAPPKP
jgi:regulator of protease activity HflC (stomatin/prohibitin superfamily)